VSRLLAVELELRRSLVAEFVGTAFLLLAVVGSGIMAQQLTADVGLQLLANSLATAGALFALISVWGPASGAHFNPVVTLWLRVGGEMSSRTSILYVLVQVAGGVVGVVFANLIFELDAVSWSTTDRVSFAKLLSEVIATFGLLMVIIGLVRSGAERQVGAGVAAYIGAAYWFTSSTSFANPAVTVARMFSDTFAGIAPAGAPLFVVAQLVGGLFAVVVMNYVYPSIPVANAAALSGELERDPDRPA